MSVWKTENVMEDIETLGIDYVNDTNGFGRLVYPKPRSALTTMFSLDQLIEKLVKEALENAVNEIELSNEMPCLGLDTENGTLPGTFVDHLLRFDTDSIECARIEGSLAGMKETNSVETLTVEEITTPENLKDPRFDITEINVNQKEETEEEYVEGERITDAVEQGTVVYWLLIPSNASSQSTKSRD